MNETQTEFLQKPVELAQPTGVARRRLLRAGLAAGPVVLALSGRSAMATGTCAKGLSPLAWNSLAPDGKNCSITSHTVTPVGTGSNPEYWKKNTDKNSTGAAAKSFNTIFSGSSSTKKIYEILDASTSSYDAYFCAAYLNINANIPYPIKLAELQQLYSSKKLGDVTLMREDQVMAFLAQTW